MKPLIRSHKRNFIAIVLLAIVCFLLLCAAIYMNSFPMAQTVSIMQEKKFDRTIVVVADRDYAPYSFFDAQGKPTGYDVELLYAIGNKIQVNIDIRLMNWADCLHAISAKEADMVTGIDYLPKEYPQLLFTMANWSDPFVCFGKKSFSTIGDLYHKRLATIKASGSYAIFFEPYKLTSRTTPYDTYTEALAAVSRGESDYAVIRYSVGRRLLASLGISDIRAVGPQLANNSNCMAASKENVELITQVDAAIVELMENGSIQSLASKWLGKYVEITSFHDIVQAYGNILLTAAGACLLALFLASTMFYRKEAAVISHENENIKRFQEYQNLLVDATHGIYEEIFEFDMTHDSLASTATQNYFSGMGVDPSLSYEQALRHMASRYIKEEFIQGYLDRFLPENVLSAFQKGTTSLDYEFMMTRDAENYHWIRIFARVFQRQADSSVRMIIFLKNTDAEVKQRQALIEKASTDELTGLYHKKTAEALICERLAHATPKERHALIVLDMDSFKRINDELGHAFGDFVLQNVARILKQFLRADDIVSRFGGDEFVFFLQNIPSTEWLKNRLDSLNEMFAKSIAAEHMTITASMGCALYPSAGGAYEALFQAADKALYVSKKQGKNRSTIFSSPYDATGK